MSLEQIDMDTLEMLATTGPAAERHMDDAEGNGDKGKGQ